MAPTVVLLHAFPLDKRLWDDVVDAVAESGWDVVVPGPARLRRVGASARTARTTSRRCRGWRATCSGSSTASA